MEPQPDKPQETPQAKEPPFDALAALGWVLAVMLSMFWMLAAAFIGAYVVETKVPNRFTYAYVLREGVELTRGEARRPLYDLIVSPAQSGRPVEFRPVGRVISLYPHDQPVEPHAFPGGATLMLSQQLRTDDQAFLKDAFANQRGARRWVWLQAMAAWVAVVLLPPAFMWGLIWVGTRHKVPE
jgi:hypothetical protein